jgi:hypothetical protein
LQCKKNEAGTALTFPNNLSDSNEISRWSTKIILKQDNDILPAVWTEPSDLYAQAK